MARLLAMPRKSKLAGIFFHQLLETPKCHNLPERPTYRFRVGRCAEHSSRLISKSSIEFMDFMITAMNLTSDGLYTK